jgi:peptidoglycan/xylan/chitin deacetylase (PgdA/CDA1 family)
MEAIPVAMGARTRAGGSLPPGRLPILTFHALDDEPAVCALHPRVFRHGVERLREHGVRTLPLDALADGVRRGVDPPSAAVVLTFDDGYRSVYEQAFPILQDAGMTATVFLTVGPRTAARDRLPPLEGRPMLDWTEIREMHRAGFAFGAHTLTHRDLSRLPTPEVESEMRVSKEIVEDRLGTGVACFAYPYGRHDARSRTLARALFACACSDALGLVSRWSDPWALERVDTYYLRTDRRFDVVLSRWLPYYLRALDVPRRLRRRVTDALRGGAALTTSS